MINYVRIIKERVPTRDYLESVGIVPDRHGMICCPIHGERTPSLKVYDDPRRGWHCFGCHAGGDVIDMVQKIENINFSEAVRRIDAAFGLGLVHHGGVDKESMRRMREEIAKINRARERQRRREQEAERIYWAAYDRWLSNENIIRDHAPGTPEDEITDEFAWAITHRTELMEAVEDAKDRWREILHARYDYRDAKMA